MRTEQLVLLSSAAGGVAVLVAVARQAMELRRLREQLEQASVSAVPESPAASLRGKARFAKLYQQERPSLLSALEKFPGAGALGAAALLGIVTVGLGLLGSSPKAGVEVPAAKVAVAQAGTVDSLNAALAQLRDSLRLATSAAAAAKPAPVKSAPIAAKPHARTAPARTEAPVLPPPVLDPNLAATAKP